MGTIFKYGSALGALMFLYAMLEFEWVTDPESKSVVLFAIAALFTAIGIWAGLKLNSSPDKLKATSSVPPDLFDLRPREFEILQLMAEGLSNQEIADALHISLSTVKSHNQNLFAKLDVKRRTQAISKAKETGLLS